MVAGPPEIVSAVCWHPTDGLTKTQALTDWVHRNLTWSRTDHRCERVHIRGREPDAGAGQTDRWPSTGVCRNRRPPAKLLNNLVQRRHRRVGGISPCRAVIFDLFDTLTVPYDDADYTTTVAVMGNAVGVTTPAVTEAWDQNWQQLLRGGFADSAAAVRAVCRHLGVTAAVDEVEAAAAAWDAYIRRAMVLKPDAIPTCSAIRVGGRRIGLISDCPPGVPALWQGTEIAQLVDAAVFSCEVRLTKPDREIYLQACKQLGMGPDACLYVADGVGRELTGAAAVGMTSVLLRHPGRLPDEFRRDAQEWRGLTVASLSEVVELLR